MSYVSPFQTYLDFDFTAQNPGTISADGTFSMGGYTWTKGNSANEATHLAITSSVGAVFKPTSTGDYNGSTRTLPYIWLPLNQIAGLGDLNWNSRIRLWANVSADNCTANFDCSVIAIDNNNTTFTYTQKRGNGTNGVGSQCVNSPSNNFVGTTFTLGAGNRVMVLDIDLARASFTSFVGSNTTVWPDPSTLIILGTQTLTNQSMPANGFTNPFSSLGIFVGAHRAGSATSLSITYARLRLDVALYG